VDCIQSPYSPDNRRKLCFPTPGYTYPIQYFSDDAVKNMCVRDAQGCRAYMTSSDGPRYVSVCRSSWALQKVVAVSRAHPRPACACDTKLPLSTECAQGCRREGGARVVSTGMHLALLLLLLLPLLLLLCVQ
jgi:hypothetical protein